MHYSVWIGNDTMRPTTLESKECSEALSFLSHCQETVNSQEKANSYLIISAAVTRKEMLKHLMERRFFYTSTQLYDMNV
jgi:hypothetical protein